MASHILWQNTAKTVTLLDIPRSIVEAQGFDSSDDHELLSVAARETPYPPSEPKTVEAKAKLTSNTVDQGLHAVYRELLTQALQEVSEQHVGNWCLTRSFVEEAKPPRKKRKLDDDRDAATSTPNYLIGKEAAHAVDDERQLPNGLLSSLAGNVDIDTQIDSRFKHDATLVSEAKTTNNLALHFHANLSDRQSVVDVKMSDALSETPGQTYRFNVPPGSTFCLGDCADSFSFRSAIRTQVQEQDSGRPDLDFILLDPPWPNRSIKRTHKTAGVTYNIVESLEDIRDMILDMHVESIMSEDCLVCIWITNKQAVRELVLGSGGFFGCLGVDLVEEWLWIKTTVSGQPTTALDALWKKPYEVLLLGRKPRRSSDNSQSLPAVKRRVIIGVPDLHSRKPCLKSLIEPMMPDRRDYRALEIFARHLVAGWWSWGNECIKFNWEDYWRQKEQSHARNDH